MEAFANHNQWNTVKDVCAKLRGAGFQALLAGGCVRDLLLKREPNDFDIATDATPDQVEGLFPLSVAVGKAFGVIVLPFQDFNVEVATFRQDLDYRDGRRPEEIRFSTPEEDAKRRDFTINALFYDPESGKVIDFVGGEKDLALRNISAVGEPALRFEEDKLRLLRAVRFAAQIDFEIEEKTLGAIKKFAPQISAVSRERVRDELLKLLKSPNRLKGLRLLNSTGLLASSFPDSAPFIFEEFEAWQQRFITAGEYEKTQSSVFPIELWLALFFAPVFPRTGERDFRDRHLKSLKIVNQQIDSVMFALEYSSEFLRPAKMRRGDLALLLSNSSAPLALLLADVIESSNTPELSSLKPPKEKIEHDRKAWISSVMKQAGIARPGEKPPMLLGGDDLKALGIPAGPKMGEILREAYLCQLEGAFSNHDSAKAWLKKFKLAL